MIYIADRRTKMRAKGANITRWNKIHKITYHKYHATPEALQKFQEEIKKREQDATGDIDNEIPF